MRLSSSIRLLPFWTALGLLAGCVSHPPALQPTPLSQNEVDQFLASGRDPRTWGITTYARPAGPHFEFANRTHLGQQARRDFVSPRNTSFPVIRAQTPITDPFPMLVDTSARQSWGAMTSAKALEYRVFAPPVGEYADHVTTAIPGYAGVGNKLLLDNLHLENPIYYLAPAKGMLGPVSRLAARPDLTPAEKKTRERLARRMPVVLGAAALRDFSFVRFDFPARRVIFATSQTFQTPNSATVLAGLPLRDWHGRPAVEARLEDQPVSLVLDTGGDFDLALSETPAGTATLVLGSLILDDIHAETYEDLGLPARFPARLGLGVISRFIVTLDYKQQRVWFESPGLPKSAKSTSPNEQPTTETIHYRGVAP